jgi:hypothetical protein
MSASGNRGPPTGGPSIEDSLREAETRSLDFPATERAIYIRAMVARTEEFKAAGKPLEYIKTQLPEFSRDYPHLFETVLQADYDRNSLQTMLALMDRMGQGSMNHHQATLVVGKRLAQKYIQPDTR